MQELDAAIVRRVLERLREPPPPVTEAMAAVKRDGIKRRNGHGEYAYRDMWIAGIDAAIRTAGANS